MSKWLRFLLVSALVAGSGVASATCSQFLQCLQSSSMSSCLSSYPNGEACLGSTSSSSVAQQIAGTTVQQVSVVSNVIGARLLSAGSGPTQKVTSAGQPVSGVAAGNGKAAYNVWGNIANTSTDYSGNSSQGNADKSGSEVVNTVVGFDYGIAPGMILGLSAAFDRGSGAMGTRASATNTEGQNFAPYFGWQITKDLALDVSAGWGKGRFSSSPTMMVADSKRSFGAVNLAYASWMGNVQLVGKAGYLDAKEKYGDSRNNGATQANTSSTNKVGQFRIGGEAGYWMNGVMPFAGLAYTTDRRRSSNAAGIADTSVLGKKAFVGSLGVNFFSVSSGIAGGLVYSQESGRSNGKNNSLGANISFKF